MLALAQVQQGHDGGLLVLGWVSLEDLIDKGEVLGAELELDGRVVVWLVAVLYAINRVISIMISIEI